MGCTDEGLRKELTNMKESGIDIEELQTYGRVTSLKSKICYEEVTFVTMFIFLYSYFEGAGWTGLG